MKSSKLNPNINNKALKSLGILAILVFIISVSIDVPSEVEADTLASNTEARAQGDCMTLFHDSSSLSKSVKKVWTISAPKKMLDGSVELWDRVFMNTVIADPKGYMYKVKAKCWVTPNGVTHKPELYNLRPF